MLLFLSEYRGEYRVYSGIVVLFILHQLSVIHFENCVNVYSVPLRQKSMGHNSNAMGQNCKQDKL